MGYYTYFSLEYYGSAEDEKALQNLKPSEDDFEFPEGIQKLIDEDDDCDWKWYGWQEDMKRLAGMFPEVTFVLHGNGEESGDIWEWRGKGEEFEFHEMEMPKFTKVLIP